MKYAFQRDFVGFTYYGLKVSLLHLSFLMPEGVCMCMREGERRGRKREKGLRETEL